MGAQGSRACAHFHRLIDMTKKTATKKTTTPKAKTTKPTKATLKKITAVKRAAGKANALAMRRRALAFSRPRSFRRRWRPSAVGRRWRARRLRRKSGPHDQAGFHPEGHLPGGEHRHAHDGRLRQQAPVVSPWASPGDSAEEFRRRAGLSSRPQEFDSCLLTSATLTDSLPDFSSCPLAALACSFERRRGRPGETQPRRRQ